MLSPHFLRVSWHCYSRNLWKSGFFGVETRHAVKTSSKSDPLQGIANVVRDQRKMRGNALRCFRKNATTFARGHPRLRLTSLHSSV
jgi:hypothetical protein